MVELLIRKKAELNRQVLIANICCLFIHFLFFRIMMEEQNYFYVL